MEIVIDNVTDFDLDHIFNCGQAFRWNRRDDGSFAGIIGCGVGHRFANISFSQDESASRFGRVVISVERGGRGDKEDEKSERAFWTRYLDLDRDYGEIKRRLSENDEVMANAISYGEGIRILNQDPWETLISFIISQNNHIPRIKACIESLCREHGERLNTREGGNHHGFPDMETLAGVSAEQLSACRLGYRAGYIVEAAEQVIRFGGMEFLDALRDVGFDEAMRALLSIRGVGPKVAACVALFGLGHTEGFPVDVWISRAMQELYSLDVDNRGRLSDYAKERFQGYAGIAQQYLFFYMRERKK
ncbi:MAG: 8-oxoguanine DNA glycosylase [Clostridiales Family XIII bacterium]|jgi:N-glycosylase/DNA lyase|nr:8-oxoguanine DNA glycosylase [Clostridiales Family XIII bacterium]